MGSTQVFIQRKVIGKMRVAISAQTRAARWMPTTEHGRARPLLSGFTTGTGTDFYDIKFSTGSAGTIASPDPRSAALFPGIASPRQGIACRGPQVIIDPERAPEEGGLVLIQGKEGARLRRLGPTIAGRIVLVSVDGSCTVETASAPLGKSVTVVVGTLFPPHRH